MASAIPDSLATTGSTLYLVVVDLPEKIIATASWAAARAALPALAVFAMFGCYWSHAEFTDGNDSHASPDDARPEVRDDGALPDVGAEDDADVEADADVTPDAEAEGDAETDADAGTCVGGWYDSTSGLCWQNPPDDTTRNWDDAVAYCDGLALGGYDDWRLPTISELRSLIRGCPATETGGSCGVTDTCLAGGCWDGGCAGCSNLGGPGAGGAYWPPGLRGMAYWYWSLSFYTTGAAYACFVGFHYGVVSTSVKRNPYYVRCVRRPGP